MWEPSIEPVAAVIFKFNWNYSSCLMASENQILLMSIENICTFGREMKTVYCQTQTSQGSNIQK